ncbi:MAG TPA: bifunctional diaminohydroxyphosphoribosylaminopyrimidine deaminase/5-amino-6-(5-phosphoribosylamino)uracil reductase RibD [Gemmatimonadaceae bacterium]|nr:bifunctional diaminohydroxyphosphoribosylaminopyrimidine deaminase/5-amino-6-(5-phosphoribosylamino)uracil reductase RibD [Gemmatimonadaceae bacterium]
MALALDAARRGWGCTAPNPMVGAVLVRGDEVVSVGWHARYGEAHAEAVALERAGPRARGATLYVTLEPCAHHGKTPPCADAVIRAGVARVVIAARDPNPEARGGLERLRAAGIAVEVGALGEEARELNAPFFFSFAARRPWVTLKLALSIDGAMADAGGRSRWITNPASRAEVHRMRAGHDAVAVGIGTALRDDPELTVRDAPAPRVPPARVIFDRQGRLPADGRIARSARTVRTLVVTGALATERRQALERLGVELVRATEPEEAMLALRERGIRSLLVEGGATLAAALLERALVDRLVIFQAPVLLGAGALRPFDGLPAADIAGAPALRVVERKAFGGDLMTVYALQELPCSPD